MENVSNIALSRQSAMRRMMDVIANNIANSSTPGFKASRLMFSEYTSDANRSSLLGSPSFVQVAGVFTDMTEGRLTNTGNPLDLALNGEGYFVVQGKDGPEYTRNGRFRLDESGQIVSSINAPLLDAGNRPILVPTGAQSIEVGADGTISADGQPLGELSIVTFGDEQKLEPTFASHFKTDEAPLPAPDAKVVQGMIEQSNVEPILEMTRLIEASRSYQSTQTMIQSEHDRKQRAIQSLTEPV